MIKIVHQGIEFYCETADDAVALAAKLTGAQLPNAHNLPGRAEEVAIAGSRWTTSRFQHFIAQLHDQQKKFLRQILGNADGLTDIVLRQNLGLSSNKAFGPILTGVSRKAKKVGVSLQDVLQTEKVILPSGERVLEFKASPTFVRIAREAGGMK